MPCHRNQHERATGSTVPVLLLPKICLFPNMAADRLFLAPADGPRFWQERPCRSRLSSCLFHKPSKCCCALLARRRQVMEMLTAESNRLSTVTGRVRSDIQDHVDWLKQYLKRLDKDLADALHSSPIWREKDNLLQNVPGVGRVTSLSLLAGLPGARHLEPQADRCPGGRGSP